MRRTLALCAGAAALALATTLNAHVTVTPAQSTVGATERYTVRVPTEGQVATTAVELDVPVGVTISGVLASGAWKSELRRDANRIVGVVWTVDIPVGHFGELVFNARNPRDGAEIAWKFTQRFADGTSRDWTPTTKLAKAQ